MQLNHAKTSVRGPTNYICSGWIYKKRKVKEYDTEGPRFFVLHKQISSTR